MDCPFADLHPRLRYQWEMSEPPVLNIGCDGDPARLSTLPHTISADIDRWRHPNFVQQNAEHLPFSSRSFNTVLLCEVLDHMENPRAAVAEAYRVATRLVVATMSYYDETVQSEPEDDWKRKIATLGQQGVVLAPGNLRLRHGHHHRWSKQDVMDLFAGYAYTITGPHGENPAEWRILIPCSS